MKWQLVLKGAKFGLTETCLGPVKARRVMMSSCVFSAEEAVQLNLLARMVAFGDLATAIEREVAPNHAVAPGAVARTKQLIAEQGGAVTSAQIEQTIQALVDTWQGTEAPEGIAAFFDKRKAVWVTDADI